jgi:hypothetical protein
MMLSSTRQLTLLSVLTAVCLGVQLTPRPPNVELTSLIVFLVGAVFGIPFGAGLGGLVMLINGFFSPYGFAGLLLPFQMVGMIIVGIGGGVYGRARENGYNVSSAIESAIGGAFLTLVYDLITNFGVAVSLWLAGTPISLAIINAIISGAPLSLVHVVSNTLVFAMLFFPLTNTLQRFLRGRNGWKKEPSLTYR